MSYSVDIDIVGWLILSVFDMIVDKMGGYIVEETGITL